MRFRTAILIASSMLAGIMFIASSGQPNPPHRAAGKDTKTASAVVVVPIQRDIVPIMALASQRRIALEHDQQVAFANAVQRAQDAQAAAQSAPAPVTSIPAAWVPTAMCEEGMRDDPNYGYFGIQEWNGFGGYANAGGAPLSVQLEWEYTYQHYPPDAPGQCHSY